jgi:drug/metabolite transporter (DMT)-like permease
MHHNLRAAGLMVAAMLMLSFNDAIIKHVSEALGIGQLLFLRGLLVTLIFSAVIKASGRPLLPGAILERWSLTRAVFEAAATLTFVSGLALLPLAINTTLVFTSPVLLTVLAALLLHETVGWRRWLAVVAGFSGILLIARPGDQGWSWAVVLPLTAAVMVACRDIATRYIAADLSSLYVALLTAALVGIAGLLVSAFDWQPIELVSITWLLLSASLLSGAYFCYISAIRLGELSFVAPFSYVSVIASIILGRLIWGDVLSWHTLAGVILIIVSGLFIFYREQRKNHGQPVNKKTRSLPRRQPAVIQPVAQPLLGIMLMIAAMILIPSMDAIAKHLSARYPLSQIVWARYFFYFLILLPMLLRYHGAAALLPAHLPLQLLRGSFLLISTALFFAAIATSPLADTLALAFVSPFVVTALSPWLLGEHVGIRRWAAVSVGFFGACIIIRPGFSEFGWGNVSALGAGICYALYLIITRKLSSGGVAPLITMTFTGLTGTVVMSLIVPFSWQMPNATDLTWMMAIGVIAAIGHYLITQSFQYASASLLAPYTYCEIVTATLLGFVIFGDFPDRWTWLGIAVIILSGLYISLRERQLLRRRALDPAQQ